MDWSKGAATVFLLVLLGQCDALAQQNQTVLGRWLTESRKGAVEIYRCADHLCGRVVWIKPGEPSTDQLNPNRALRTRPICGLVLMGGFRPSGKDQWSGGWAYSPEVGKTYSARMTLQPDGTLKLRGYVGIPLLGESQIWTPASPALGSCEAR